MKKTKVLLTLACAALLVVASVMGTLAYLQDTDSVKNTFTYGKVDITLDEAKVDLYGKEVGNTRVTENEYKLIPNHEYKKDPVVHVVSGSEKCYLFVKVENGLADIEVSTIASQMTINGWTPIAENSNVYYYKDIVDASSATEDVPVFETIKIDEHANVAAYEGKEIVVTAYAVQADGFDNAQAAWSATYGA